VRPTLRYPAYDVEIGHTSFALTDIGGIVDIDASNSPNFNNVVTGLTNGTDDFVEAGVTLLTMRIPAGGGATVTEGGLFAPGFVPDLVGARIAFVRLVVDGLDSGVLACPSGAGRFLALKARWQFWGTLPPGLFLKVNCSPCHASQLIAFSAVVGNEGPPITANVRFTVTPPSGSPINLLGAPWSTTFPPGESPVPLVSFVVPGDAPNGAYIVEAALLDPDRGVTLARRSMKVVKQ
jgi:hypothetical protein